MYTTKMEDTREGVGWYGTFEEKGSIGSNTDRTLIKRPVKPGIDTLKNRRTP